MFSVQRTTTNTQISLEKEKELRILRIRLYNFCRYNISRLHRALCSMSMFQNAVDKISYEYFFSRLWLTTHCKTGKIVRRACIEYSIDLYCFRNCLLCNLNAKCTPNEKKLSERVKEKQYYYLFYIFCFA